MDRLQSMEVFRWVAELGSFTRAADRLNLGKASVTTHVAQLESRLGTRLLNRTTRRLSLTDDGAAYLEHVRRVLADIEESEAALRRGRSVPRGRLRVDMPVAVGRLVVIPALPRFIAQYPELSVVASVNDQVVNIVDEGIDAAIRVGPLPDSTFVARRVYEMRWMTCASPDYLEREGAPTKPEDLANHQCLGFYHPTERVVRDWVFERDGARVNVPPGGRVAVGSQEALLATAIAGAGIVQVPELIAKRALAAGTLQLVLEDWRRTDPLPVHVLYPQNRHLSAKVRAFTEFVMGLFPRKKAGD